MHINAASLPMRATLAADVAIVGAGPAGIALALELADAGHQVLLIESGGNSYSREAQHLSNTAGEDRSHAPMSRAVRRQIGGASNLWSGRCVPFDPVDFEARKIVGDARWPVGYRELESYFPAACRWFKCGQPIFDAAQIPDLAANSLIPGWPGGEVCATSLERYSLPTNFGRVYQARLKSSPLLTLISELTCTEIVSHPDGRSVEHLAARTLSGNQIRVRARRYVIAAGGVESTRLLFASNRHQPAGIGNHSGHLGHWYMGHVGMTIARAHFSTPPKATIYDFERDPEGVYVRRRFTFSRDYLIEHDLPNIAMYIENPDMSDPSHGNGILSIIYLILASPLGHHVISEGVRHSKIDTDSPPSTWLHLRNVVRHLPGTARFAFTFGYRRFLRPGRKVPGFVVPSPTNSYPLYYHAEHLPHHDSRVMPTNETDALGMPRVATNLHFADADIRNAIRAHEHLDRYLRRFGLGHLEYLFEDPEQELRRRLVDGYHQAGTTRMSDRPEDGVLDQNLAVHGFEDLFVASSSAFATSGQANSTFMIVVLALRLANHLRRSLSLDER
jgi:choline dehydrogenase-like flavoprotein